MISSTNDYFCLHFLYAVYLEASFHPFFVSPSPPSSACFISSQLFHPDGSAALTPRILPLASVFGRNVNDSDWGLWGVTQECGSGVMDWERARWSVWVGVSG